ncbi:MAG: RES domain-containing protein [Planctomycetes bacterium]|nr:RES domain-containing protein [Planctomycetota bacterium]
MLAWRICSRRYSAFDGTGARIHGGRWNWPGIPVVYTSGSLSLAAMELLVHIDPDLVPEDLVSIGVEIPAAVETSVLDESDLPASWQAYPAPDVCRAIGSSWVKSRRTAVLSVPSAVIPQERNFLLNSAHPDFRRLRILKPVPFHLDPRLLK